MIEKTDYGGCPLCEKDWESYSWYVNCMRLISHVYRVHGFENAQQHLQELRRQGAGGGNE